MKFDIGDLIIYDHVPGMIVEITNKIFPSGDIIVKYPTREMKMKVYEKYGYYIQEEELANKLLMSKQRIIEHIKDKKCFIYKRKKDEEI